MGEQRSSTTKAKIEAVFARLDRLGLGEDGEDVADVQESMRRADLFMYVTLAPLQPVLN